MKALLITRCGCSREFQLPEDPPPRELEVPLDLDKPKVWVPIALPRHLTLGWLGLRRFRLEEKRDGQPIYREVTL